MNATFSASTSGKTASGSTPFDQIAALEASEAERVKRELQALEQEQKKVVKSLQEKQTKEEQEMRDGAREELKLFREKELSHILEEAKTAGVAELKRVEDAYKKNEKGIVQSLAKKLISSDSALAA